MTSEQADTIILLLKMLVAVVALHWGCTQFQTLMYGIRGRHFWG